MYKTHVSPNTNSVQGRSASTGIKPTRAGNAKHIHATVESQYSSAFNSSGTKGRNLVMVSVIILLYINLDRILISVFLDLGLSASRVTVLTARIRLFFTLNGAQTKSACRCILHRIEHITWRSICRNRIPSPRMDSLYDLNIFFSFLFFFFLALKNSLYIQILQTASQSVFIRSKIGSMD